MPKNITERYKTDPDFRERMKANSRKRYAEMKEALEMMKKMKADQISPAPAPCPPPSSSADQSKPS